jgi:hypothetical protein
VTWRWRGWSRPPGTPVPFADEPPDPRVYAAAEVAAYAPPTEPAATYASPTEPVPLRRIDPTIVAARWALHAMVLRDRLQALFDDPDSTRALQNAREALEETLSFKANR